MDISQIIMVSVLLVVTLWRKDIILYLILAPVMVAMGLSWYDSYHTPPGMITSLALMLVGSYCFALGVFNMLKDKGE
jgi:hypothetical protein